MATGEKYPVLNRDNVTIAIQIQLSQKQKFFITFWLHFRNLSESLEKKDDPHSFCISEINDFENVVR